MPAIPHEAMALTLEAGLYRGLSFEQYQCMNKRAKEWLHELRMSV